MTGVSTERRSFSVMQEGRALVIFKVFLRTVQGEPLIFRRVGIQLVDEQTGSTWSLDNGLAIAGPLNGEALQSAPSLTSYDWAWRDFYPGTEFYQALP